jgi:hypothetical protein
MDGRKMLAAVLSLWVSTMVFCRQDINVSDEHTTSIFGAEDIIFQVHMPSQI